MSQGARLTSIEAIPFLKAALQIFAEEVAAALAEADMEVGRAEQWIEGDRRDYWSHQIRRGYEQVAELRIALDRALLFKSMDGEPAPCYDERKALQRAKQRLKFSEEKLEAVRRWTRVIAREVIEFRAIMNHLAEWLQVDYPKAVAALDRMAASLDTYLAIQASVAAPAPVAAAGESAAGDAMPSAARSGDAAAAAGPATAEAPPPAAPPGPSAAQEPSP